MAALTSKSRRKLKKSQFAGPGKSYPVDTRGRAVAAKGRATQAFRKGRISKATRDKIHAKANRKLYGKSKGKGK